MLILRLWVMYWVAGIANSKLPPRWNLLKRLLGVWEG